MSGRGSIFYHTETLRVEAQIVGAIFSHTRFASRDPISEIKCNALGAAPIGEICDAHIIRHGASFRGCFAFTTIAKAGEAASLSGGSIFHRTTIH